MRGYRVALAIIIGLWCVMFIRIGTLWAQLPEKVASHFGPSGRADGWMSRTNFLLFTLVLEVGVTALVLAVPSWVRHAPQLVNLPHKQYWLDPGRWPQAVGRLRSWMAWFTVALTGLLVGANELVLQANLNPGEQGAALDNRAFWVLLAAFLTFVAVWMVGFYRQFRPPRA